MQQDGFIDKELIPAAQIPEEELPLCKHWSWDRILRSCFIKQADVILAFLLFPPSLYIGAETGQFPFL